MIGVIDLRSCLEGWPYDAEKNVRMGRGIDGREIILVRQPMGLEQYEVDGLPDGWRKDGGEAVLALHAARVDAAKRIPAAMAIKVVADDCTKPLQEACAYYCRLIVLFRLKDWIRAARDATQILHLLQFARQHAPYEEDRLQLDSWYPHIARLNVVAEAMILLENGRYRDAFQTVRYTIDGLEAFARQEPDPRKLAHALLEGIRGSLANRPVFHPYEERSFVQQDDYWTIRYQGDTAFLKSTRGLKCLACLLRDPGREFHVTQLLASGLAAVSDKLIKEFRPSDGDRFATPKLDDHGPILDARAKVEYRQRLSELRQELADAQQFNDSERATRAQDEIHAISQHLASAIGLGGRDRKTSSEAERARCAVTKRLKKAIQKISEAIPSLGRHLVTRVKTGYFCSYNPHPDRAVAWKF